MKSLTKIIFLLILLCGIKTIAQSKSGDCNMAVTYSEMAFKNFKKAYKSSFPDDMKILLKKAVKDAEEASAYALICNCPLAKNYALNAVTFGNKALKATNEEDSKKFSKQAMNMSLDVMTATPNCK